MRTFLLLFFPLSLLAQSPFKDSVEVHRTDTIYFAFGSAEVDDRARTRVQGVVADRPGDLELYLEGHTDAVGGNAANERLARQRSEATREAAIAAGWPAEAVELRHFGERRLEVPTAGRERRNRRVLLRSGLPRRYALLRGTVMDQDGTPLPGGVIATGKYLADTLRADDTGRYAIWLPVDELIRLEFYAEEHFFDSQLLRLTSDLDTLPTLYIKLASARPGAMIAVRDLNFVGNKTELLPEGQVALRRLVQFLKFTPELRVELAGHVNGVGPPARKGSWFFTLAMARARKVYDELIAAGIEPERLEWKGYSNFEMIYANPQTEEEKRTNRRVEIRVLE